MNKDALKNHPTKQKNMYIYGIMEFFEKLVGGGWETGSISGYIYPC